MAQPKVSVVITCYNYGQYVESALQSVFSQTFQDFEIILVDDGSTDDSEERIRPFLSDSRLKYIKQENSGQAKAKNRGINESSGEFIAFLDSDDKWNKTKLEKQLPLFLNKDVGVVYSKAKYIDEYDHPVNIVLKDKYMRPRNGKVTDFLYMNNFVPFSSSIVRCGGFKEFGVFDESLPMGIDWDLWLRLSTQYKFDFVDEPLLIYRVGHPGQMSKMVEKRHSCSDQIMKQFIHQYPEIVSPNIIRRALGYTYCNRGDYFGGKDLSLANRYYLMALRQSPFDVRAYISIIRLIIKKRYGYLDLI